MSERDEAQGDWCAATETYRVDRRGRDNEVAAKANVSLANVKALSAGLSQHRSFAAIRPRSQLSSVSL